MTSAVATIFDIPSRGRGYGFLACALFGAFWAISSLAEWPSRWRLAGYATTVLITAVLMAAAIRMIRHARVPTSTSAAPGTRGRRVWRIFLAIFMAEIVALNIAALWLDRHHQTQYLLPTIAVIVGLHFYPLASLFRASRYLATATVMTLTGMAGVIAIAMGMVAPAIVSIICAICALTLWITGFSWQLIPVGDRSTS